MKEMKIIELKLNFMERWYTSGRGDFQGRVYILWRVGYI